MEKYRYPWILPESERMKCVCADCKRPYDTFQDMVIPNDLWLKVSPFGDEGGLLCPTCLVNRLVHTGDWYSTGLYVLKRSDDVENILTTKVSYKEDQYPYEMQGET